MGEFWTRYFLDNGQRMSRRQLKKVERLEEEILTCLKMIDRLEDIVEGHSHEIKRIKSGGEEKANYAINTDF
jgi:hypothetical protein